MFLIVTYNFTVLLSLLFIVIWPSSRSHDRTTGHQYNGLLNDQHGVQAFRFWHKNAEHFLHHSLQNHALDQALNNRNDFLINKSSFAATDLNGMPFHTTLRSILLENAGVFNNPPLLCIQYIYFSSKEKKFIHEFENDNCNRWPFSYRRKMFVSILQSIVDNYPDVILTDDDFDFFIDVSDATAINPNLFTALRRPLLTQGIARSSGDKYTLPYPDMYQISVFNMWMNWTKSTLTPDLQAWTTVLSKRYIINQFTTPWRDKVHGVIFCGTNHTTLNPHNRSEWLHPRQDVGYFYSSENCTRRNCSNSDDKSYGSITIHLKRRGEIVYNPNQMGKGWRYQLNIDGISTSFDGTVWKLSSNSTVFYIIPDPAMQQSSRDYFKLHGSFKTIPMVWEGWYSPLFHPNIHFLAIAPDQIEDALQWCETFENQCEQMAINARKTAEHVLNPHVMYSYVARLLKYLQDWHFEVRSKYRIKLENQEADHDYKDDAHI